jgi:hypothetical protein
MKKWCYKINDKEFGPISEEELLHAIEYGELTENTLIQDSEMDIWVKASSIDGLIPKKSEFFEQEKRLPIWQTISEAYFFITKNIHILWKPLLITALLMICLNSFLFPIGIKTFWLHRAVYSIAFVIFTITTHRIVILGKDSVSLYGLSWSRREWIFVLYTIGIYIGMTILFFLLSPIFMMLVSSGIQYLIFIAILPLLVVSVRLSILFPAIAVDKIDIGWQWAMAVTKNNGLRMVAVLLVIPFLVKIVTNYISGISIPLNILAETITVILLAFEIVVLSLSFKYLTDD